MSENEDISKENETNSDSRLQDEEITRIQQNEGTRDEKDLEESEDGSKNNKNKCVKEIGSIQNFSDLIKDGSFIVLSECGEDGQQSQETVEDDEDLGFTIDINPVQEKKSSSNVPLFKRSSKTVLKEEDKKQKILDEANSNKIVRNLCFNCDGEHPLRDCDLPRDTKRINKARKLRNSRTERYHVDVEQRFAHIKPGNISEKLINALGLRHNEIPPMFYKMRLLKYPPAWLEEAKVAHSGITLFGSKGCTVLGSDDDEGELNESKLRYDLSKIISFPGFNADPGNGYYDDFKYQGVPQFSLIDSKESFIQSFKYNAAKQGYRRKRLKIDVDGHEDFIRNEEMNTTDMDVDEDETKKINQNLYFPLFLLNQPPPPAEKPPTLPPPPPEDDEEGELKDETGDLLKDNFEETRLNTDGFQELSLDDLKNKQAELLKLLNNNEEKLDNSNLESEVVKSSSENLNEICIKETKSTDTLKEKNLSDSTEIITEFKDEIQINENKSNLIGSIIGTPLLKFSPYDDLPAGHLFQEGVSDVINFENLPDSTGKYDQMKKLLYKVRKKIVEINERVDD